ncbi:MAG: hypothetical protein P8Y80_11070 [Acidobacteriota bacterium]
MSVRYSSRKRSRELIQKDGGIASMWYRKSMAAGELWPCGNDAGLKGLVYHRFTLGRSGWIAAQI